MVRSLGHNAIPEAGVEEATKLRDGLLAKEVKGSSLIARRIRWWLISQQCMQMDCNVGNGAI